MQGTRRSSLEWWWNTALGRLLSACIAVFVLQVVLGQLGRAEWIENSFGLSLEGLLHGQLWQLLTFQFLHGSLFHLVANVVGIYCIGRPLARVVGPRFILVVWVIAGLAGGMSQIIWNKYSYVIGASASGFAFLVAFAVLFPNVKVIALFIPFPVKIWHFALGSVIATVGFILFPRVMPGVGHVAHLGGAVIGFAAGRWIRSRLPMIVPGAGGFGFGRSN